MENWDVEGLERTDEKFYILLRTRERE